LIYRVPREPSAPRIAVWRKLRALGVAQLGDGLVALPEDARTREHLEWVADQVIEARGTALLLRAQALAHRDERALAQSMSQPRSKPRLPAPSNGPEFSSGFAPTSARSRSATTSHRPNATMLWRR
jgi:hypothetical protein